jgi:sphingomyelin phosphodiesterase acid-like 3
MAAVFWAAPGLMAQATQPEKPKVANASGPGAKALVEALFISDIHFEPFWDPSKVAQLETAPVSGWNTILAEPAAADRTARFAELQDACRARGVDASYALYQSSLKAIRANAGGAKFVVLSGDLISHDFDCKYKTTEPTANPGDYRAFVEKTIEYVMDELRGTLPGVPVYAALGNNDSDCGDYLLDANSPFLKALAVSLAGDVRGPERATALRTFGEEGYYSVTLPAPLGRVRMLVLDNLFMARRYATCGGKDDPAPAEAQIAWMEQQLDAARKNHEKAWLMAHIPPGVDPYATARKSLDLCTGGKPMMFFKSEAFPDALARYGDVITLAIFAHTHMDEVHLLKPQGGGATQEGVAIKLVPSISPVDGNNPSFTVAEIDVATTGMKDYQVYTASDATGTDTTWSEEYDFAKTYKEPAYTAASVSDLITKFEADTMAQTALSQSYIHNYGAGMKELEVFWKPYTCALTNEGADDFRNCVCGK